MNLGKHSFSILHSAFCIAVAASTAMAATEADSNSTFVFIDKGESTFWHTATNATLSLPVDFPRGVSSATLTVSAPCYSASYAITASGRFALTLPAVTSPDTENVYLLRLVFADGTTREALLGLVQSYGSDGEATTRVRDQSATHVWERAARVTVIPVPSGIESFTIDGVAADTGLDGDAGWYAARMRGGQTVALGLNDGAETFAATLFRPPEQTTIIMR